MFKSVYPSQYVCLHVYVHPSVRPFAPTARFVIVIAIAKLLKRHSKAKHRAPAYSRALRKSEDSLCEVQVRLPESQRRQDRC